jgi:peptidoglycan hydrolase CwlO-like protein
MEGPLTKDQLRQRIEKNLKEIQENQEADAALESQIDSLRAEATDLSNRLRALRDQVKKDLDALDPEMRP